MGVSLHDNIERRILCFNIYIIRVVLRYGRFANLETAGTMTMLYAVSQLVRIRKGEGVT